MPGKARLEKAGAMGVERHLANLTGKERSYPSPLPPPQDPMATARLGGVVPLAHSARMSTREPAPARAPANHSRPAQRSRGSAPTKCPTKCSTKCPTKNVQAQNPPKPMRNAHKLGLNNYVESKFGAVVWQYQRPFCLTPVLSSGFVERKFCRNGNFVETEILSKRKFCRNGNFVERKFCQVLSNDNAICSFGCLCHGRPTQSAQRAAVNNAQRHAGDILDHPSAALPKIDFVFEKFGFGSNFGLCMI